MSLPSELSIALPPTFGSSFWPADAAAQTSTDPSPEASLPAWSAAPYRRPVERAFAALQAGLDLNTRFIQHVQQRSHAEHAYARALSSPPALPVFEPPVFPAAAAAARLLNGFDALAQDRVPGLAHASSALAAAHAVSTIPISAAHSAAATALDASVAAPLANWTADYTGKLQRSFEQLDAQLDKLSDKADIVERVRQSYYAKCRAADEAEDDEAQSQAEPEAAPPEPAPAPTAQKQAESPPAKSPEKQEQNLPGATEAAANTLSSAPVPVDGAPRPAGPRRQPQRQGTLSSLVHRLEATAQASPVFSNLRQAVSGLGEPRALRLRREAVQLEQRYRGEVAGLDVARADFEREWATTLSKMQNWETQRGRALKAALGQYASALVPLLPAGTPAAVDLAELPASYSSTADVLALIRAHGSAPYVPEPPVFAPYYPHDPATLAGYGQLGFGMHLVRWTRASALAALPAEHSDVDIDALAAHAASAGLPQPPRALRLLLAALARAYADPARWPLADGINKDSDEAEHARQGERRRAWIYDVPLTAVHRLRFGLIAALSRAQPDTAIFSRVLDVADPPVLAACARTWAEELSVSLVPQTLWDTVWSVYRAASDQAERKRRSYQDTEGKGKDKDNKVKSEGEGEGEGEGEEGLPPLSTEDARAIQTATEGDLRSVLLKLPRVHIACLDAIIAPLATLYAARPNADVGGGDDDPLYAQKIGISLGRVLLRPPEERGGTRVARHPALLAMDLVMRYESTLAPVVKEATGQRDYLGFGSSDADRRKAVAALSLPRRAWPPPPPPLPSTGAPPAQTQSGAHQVLTSSPMLAQSPSDVTSQLPGPNSNQNPGPSSDPSATAEEDLDLPSKPRMPSLRTDPASLQPPVNVGRQPSLRQRGQAALDSIGDAWAQTPLAERVLGFWSESTNRVADGFASLRAQEQESESGDDEDEKTPTVSVKPSTLGSSLLSSAKATSASMTSGPEKPLSEPVQTDLEPAAARGEGAETEGVTGDVSNQQEPGNGKPLQSQPADAAAKQPAQVEAKSTPTPLSRSLSSSSTRPDPQSDSDAFLPSTATDAPRLGPPASLRGPVSSPDQRPAQTKAPPPSGGRSPASASLSGPASGKQSPNKSPTSPSKPTTTSKRAPGSPSKVPASANMNSPKRVAPRVPLSTGSPVARTARGTPRSTSPKKQVGSNVERLSRQFQSQGQHQNPSESQSRSSSGPGSGPGSGPPTPDLAGGATRRTSLGGPRPRPSGSRRAP